MKNQRFRRIISTFMMIIMIITLVPSVSFAEKKTAAAESAESVIVEEENEVSEEKIKVVEESAMEAHAEDCGEDEVEYEAPQLKTQSKTENFSKNYTLGSNAAANVVAVAAAQIGKTQAELGYTEAWCADFVCDVGKLAGVASNVIPWEYASRGGVRYLYSYMINSCNASVVSSRQAGDFVFYYCNSCQTYVHVGIVADSSYQIEGNVNGQVYKYNTYYNDANGHSVSNGVISRVYVRPNYSNTPVTVTMSWQNDTCNPGKTDAYIYTKAVANVSGTYTQAGITVWDSVGNVVGSKTEYISTSSSYLEIWYNLTEELGITLKPGTNYTYQLFTVFNGTEYTGSVKTFQTTAEASSSLATPTLVSATSDDDGVTVKWDSVSGATGYRVFRKTADSDWSSVGNSTTTSYKDTSVTDGITYYYTVRAYQDTYDMAEANSYSTTYWSGYDETGLQVTYTEKEKEPPVIDTDSITYEQLDDNKAKITVKATDNVGIEKITLWLKKMPVGDKDAEMTRANWWVTTMEYKDGVYETEYDGSLGQLGTDCPVDIYLIAYDEAGNYTVLRKPEHFSDSIGWFGYYYIVTEGDTLISLEKEDEYTLTETEDSTYNYVGWYTTNPEVVSVDSSGKITALNEGEAVVLEIRHMANTTWYVAASYKVEVGVDRNPFVDVYETDYYYDAVLWAYENGITTGKTDTEFQPDVECTRAQVVTFLWRANGSPEPKTTENPFTDVSTSDYYYKAVLWAYENGITTGKTDTEFQPDMIVTRSQFVTFLWRAEGEPATTISNPFEDVSEGQYYTDAILWAYENEITKGKDETHFQPYVNCIRAQVVTFLYRADQ